MDFLSLVQARYSCKAYTDTPIDDQQLAAVLEAGRLAPTAKTVSRSVSMCSKALVPSPK